MILVTLLAISFSAATVDPAVIDRLAQESMKAWSAPGVAVAVGGPEGILYAKGYGVKRLGSADPVTPKTIFAIGSTTKAFTVAALGTLVDQGRLNWDDPVRVHLPEFRLSDPSATELATIRDLVSHRTGLSRNDALWYGSPWSREEILDRISRAALTKPFRSAWQYQNIMFLAAGQAATRTAGAADWEELVQRRILDPLGMKDTNFHPPDSSQAAEFAAPHAKRSGKVQLIPWRNIDNIGPAGSINSNVEDLAKWVRVHLNEGEPILQGATLREMHTPQMAMRREEWGRNFTDETNQMTYGLGWFLQDFRGIHTVNHGGAIDGFRAQITILPKQKQAVIVLANLGEDNMPEALRWKIVDHLIAAPAGKDWDKFLIERGERAATASRVSSKRVEGTKPSLPLSSYIGDFREPAYGIARVTQTTKGLELAWSSNRLPLEHHHYDTFASKDLRVTGLVNFGLDTAGTVAKLAFQGMEFHRISPALDGAKTGDLFVRALKLGQGEKVIVRYDPDYQHELTAPIEKSIRDAGGVVAASLAYTAKGSTADCPAFNRLLADATVYLWMPLREDTREVTPCETQSLVKWLDAGGTHREIHFHWNGGSVLADGLVTDHQPEFDAIYAGALNVDHARISREQDLAIQALRSGTVRVHTPSGTDITFKVGDRPFNKQDGDASAERMKQAKVRVDREIELPAGVLRVAPLEETANGIIVVPEARFGTTVARNVRLTIQSGRVAQITASYGKDAVEAVLNQGGDAARKFREFGLGFNPKLIAPKGSRILPYFAYGTGMVRMSLGDNEEIGGAVRGGAYRRWFFFPDATVEVEGKVISRPGSLQLP